ncbi:hypothetical protein COBT_000224 [Conglomerata obtusa]
MNERDLLKLVESHHLTLKQALNTCSNQASFIDLYISRNRISLTELAPYYPYLNTKSKLVLFKYTNIQPEEDIYVQLLDTYKDDPPVLSRLITDCTNTDALGDWMSLHGCEVCLGCFETYVNNFGIRKLNSCFDNGVRRLIESDDERERLIGGRIVEILSDEVKNKSGINLDALVKKKDLNIAEEESNGKKIYNAKENEKKQLLDIKGQDLTKNYTLNLFEKENEKKEYFAIKEETFYKKNLNVFEESEKNCFNVNKEQPNKNKDSTALEENEKKKYNFNNHKLTINKYLNALKKHNDKEDIYPKKDNFIPYAKDLNHVKDKNSNKDNNENSVFCQQNVIKIKDRNKELFYEEHRQRMNKNSEYLTSKEFSDETFIQNLNDLNILNKFDQNNKTIEYDQMNKTLHLKTNASDDDLADENTKNVNEFTLEKDLNYTNKIKNAIDNENKYNSREHHTLNDKCSSNIKNENITDFVEKNDKIYINECFRLEKLKLEMTKPHSIQASIKLITKNKSKEETLYSLTILPYLITTTTKRMLIRVSKELLSYIINLDNDKIENLENYKVKIITTVLENDFENVYEYLICDILVNTNLLGKLIVIEALNRVVNVIDNYKTLNIFNCFVEIFKELKINNKILKVNIKCLITNLMIKLEQDIKVINLGNIILEEIDLKE